MNNAKLLVRFIHYYHQRPMGRHSKFLYKQAHGIREFINLPTSPERCGAGFRYNISYCLDCKSHTTLLHRTDHPLLSKCTKCSTGNTDLISSDINQHFAGYTNPAVTCLYMLDFSVQTEVFNILLDNGAHS